MPTLPLSHALDGGKEGHARQVIFHRRAASDLSFHLSYCGCLWMPPRQWDPVLLTLLFPPSREALHLACVQSSSCGCAEPDAFLLFPLLSQNLKPSGQLRKYLIDSLLRLLASLLLLPVFFSSLKLAQEDLLAVGVCWPYHLAIRTTAGAPGSAHLLAACWEERSFFSES